MHQHVLLYIKQGLEAYQKAFSPVIIIEDQYLQTFVHTLSKKEATKNYFFYKSNTKHEADRTDYFKPRVVHRNPIPKIICSQDN